jgi:hypothetical protein
VTRRILTLLLAQAAVGLGLVGLAPGRAEASLVTTYGTSGGFNNPVPSRQLFHLTDASGNVETVALWFTGVAPTSPTGSGPVAIGVLNVNVVGFASAVAQVSAPLTVRVDQTSPVFGSEAFAGTVSGQLGPGSAAFDLKFANSVINIGNMRYTLVTDAPGSDSHLLSTAFAGQGIVTKTLYATLTDPPLLVPEPSTLALTLTGSLAAAGFWGRRRRLAVR